MALDRSTTLEYTLKSTQAAQTGFTGFLFFLKKKSGEENVGDKARRDRRSCGGGYDQNTVY